MKISASDFFIQPFLMSIVITKKAPSMSSKIEFL
jgi:hypothetical protein